VGADKRVVLGFVEPHFFAGFSGGYKGVFPGVTDIDSIMHYHRAAVIGDENSTWGLLKDNPTQEMIRRYGSLLPVDFCINVALNHRHEITHFFCGETLQAHEQGCSYVKEAAMTACRHRFPIVITSNSGYPLDQNLYQSVKGMSAASQIVSKDGLIIMAARCHDGFPAHGNFTRLLYDAPSPEKLLETIMAPGFRMHDQWQAQKLALILKRARVALYSEIPPGEVQRAHLEPIIDLNAYIEEQLQQNGTDTPVAVMPEGPMTIPYLSPG